MNPDQNGGGGATAPQSTGGKMGGRPPGPPTRTAYGGNKPIEKCKKSNKMYVKNFKTILIVGSSIAFIAMDSRSPSDALPMATFY